MQHNNQEGADFCLEQQCSVFYAFTHHIVSFYMHLAFEQSLTFLTRSVYAVIPISVNHLLQDLEKKRIIPGIYPIFQIKYL